MIAYRPTTWKELRGEYKASIADVEKAPNTFYDPSKDNSTEYVLNITFQLEDPVTLDAIMYTQKFVAPLVGGKSLFQQLLDAKGELPDLKGGEFDEASLIDLELIVTMGERKSNKDGKIYSTVASVRKYEGKAKAKKPRKQPEPDVAPF